MGKAFENVELISFHSVSKGMVGECGRRGGYFECTGGCVRLEKASLPPTHSHTFLPSHPICICSFINFLFIHVTLGIQAEVMDQFYKIASISLCPPVSGQLMVGLMVNPPKQGDASYPAYNEEMNSIFSKSLYSFLFLSIHIIYICTFAFLIRFSKKKSRGIIWRVEYPRRCYMQSCAGLY